MRIDILSLFPDVVKTWFNYSIISRAIGKKIIEVYFHDIRDYTTLNNKQADDYPYGGGSGMVLMAEPIARCIDSLKQETQYDEIIYPCPDGVVFNQSMANQLVSKKNLMFICGHYKGIDQRIRDTYVTKEISIGDYVISGGELSSAVICDAIIRLLPNVISDSSSALTDSFQDELLEAPLYTRPKSWRNQDVPDILLSGDHKKIDTWRHKKSMEKTKKKRPDLLK